MSSILFEFSKNLSSIRQELGWTQAEVARRTGISRPAIVGYENGPKEMPRPYALAIYAVIVTEVERRRENFQELVSADWNNDQLRPQVILKLAAQGLNCRTAQSCLLKLIRYYGIFLESQLYSGETFLKPDTDYLRTKLREWDFKLFMKPLDLAQVKAIGMEDLHNNLDYWIMLENASDTAIMSSKLPYHFAKLVEIIFDIYLTGIISKIDDITMHNFLERIEQDGEKLNPDGSEENAEG